MPNASSDAGSPSAHSPHGPAPWYGPAEALPAVEQSPPRSRPPWPSPLRGLYTGGNSTSHETTLGRLERQPNRPMGRGAFTRQPLHDMGRELDGVRWHQLASATMPHSGRHRRLHDLRPPLCRYSRRGAGLRRSVRTCLTPPTTVLPTPCTFLPCRTLGGHGRRPWDTIRPLTGARPEPSAPSTPYLFRRKALLPQQSSPRHQLTPQGTDTP
jgi:hypothetical protein